MLRAALGRQPFRQRGEAAQVDEQEAAVVALPVDPARDLDGLAGMRGAEQILSSAWSVIVICQFAVSLGISMVLAVMAFTPWFERSYPSLAQVLVPIRNPLVAVMVASTAANGHLESLMLLPLLLIGPFFVHGLRVRAALLAVVASFAAFLVSALLFCLPWLVIARSSVLIVIVGAACGLVALHRERTSRRSFLESRLIADLAQRDALTGLNNRRVLDIGCGTGFWTDYYVSRGAHYTGLDIAQVSVDKLQARYPEQRFARADVSEGVPGGP